MARHVRSRRQGAYTTDPQHMPQAHRKHQQWSPGRLLNWAKTLGPNVLLMTKAMLTRKAHPEQAYRGCLGLLNLSRNYDAQRLDKACERAMSIGSPNVRSVKSILQHGMDQLDPPLNESATHNESPSGDDHDNIRGPQYYH